jgi:rod shape-determining protein MreC
LFLGYVIAVVGVLFALLLLVIAKLDPQGFSAIRGAALDVTAPASSGGRSVVRLVSGGGESIGNYFMAASKNAELKRELAASRRRLVEARAIEFENRRLRALLKLSETVSNRVTTGRIVGSSFDSSRRLATLSAGSSDGVRPGQPVRSPEGLIGRILETGRWASRVLLITDGGSNVPVQLVRNGTAAIASGRGDGLIDLKTLEVGESPFKRGDIVVTSGVGGVYPPLVPVAIVVKADRDATVARPLAHPARIDFAIVETIYQPAASAPVNAAEAAQLESAE